MPLGQYQGLTGFQQNITDVLEGPAMFWNVKKG